MSVPGHSYRPSWHSGVRCYCHDKTDTDLQQESKHASREVAAAQPAAQRQLVWLPPYSVVVPPKKPGVQVWFQLNGTRWVTGRLSEVGADGVCVVAWGRFRLFREYDDLHVRVLPALP